MWEFSSTEFEAAVDFLVTTMTELAVLFLLISLLVSYINMKLPAEKVRRLLAGNSGYGVAVLLGAVTPFCSCSTLPMTVGLLKARAAFGPVMSFLFTSPLLNPFIVGLFWITFGAQVTLLYAGFVLGLAVISGALLQMFKFERFIKEGLISETSCDSQSLSSTCCEPVSASASKPLARADSCCGNIKEMSDCCDSASTPKSLGDAKSANQTKSKAKSLFPSRGRALVNDSLSQFISFLPYMALGVAVGAVLHGFVPMSFFSGLSQNNSLLMIPLAALVGVFLYVRASTMVPIATSLIAKGMSLGAVMSLTIGGAGASLPEMIMLKRMFHWPLLLAFISLVFLTACLTGLAVELI